MESDDVISDNIEVVPVVVNVSFKIFPDHVEVDVLKSDAPSTAPAGIDALSSLLSAHPAPAAAPVDNVSPAGPAVPVTADEQSFADWMAGALRREGMTMEAAARQLGVSVKTVSRWVGGATEPRLRDLRRIRELFGEIPFT